MSDDSNALIREIEEEVRREKLARLWDQYGVAAIVAVVAAVVMLGAWQWYVAYSRDRAQISGGRFQEALTSLDGDKKTEGVALLEQIVENGPSNYATLARLRLAAERRANGKPDEALALYESVASGSGGDELLQSFANLQIASLKVDNGTWTEAQNRLNALATDDSPWRFTARELLGLAAYKHQQWDAAKEAYAALLADQAAPQTIRQRAQTAMAMITREEAERAAVAPVQTDGKAPDKSGSIKLDNETAKGDPNATVPTNADLKKDKTGADGSGGKVGDGATAPAPASSSGAGANNDAVTNN